MDIEDKAGVAFELDSGIIRTQPHKTRSEGAVEFASRDRPIKAGLAGTNAPLKRVRA
jgi:hypothetical protein